MIKIRLIIAHLIIFLTISPLNIRAPFGQSYGLSNKDQEILLSPHNISIFKRPFCILGPQTWWKKENEKLDIVKWHQRYIKKGPNFFNINRKLEKSTLLTGSPKQLTLDFFLNKGLSLTQIEFGLFVMTLFGEARNLHTRSIEMVARVINNRKGDRTYTETVTELAQFSTWYYTNQRDNTVMLCPSKEHQKSWKKVFKVAIKNFNRKDTFLGSKHYFSPYNMVPRYRTPEWAKGNYAVGFGGHIFLVDKKFKEKNKNLQVVYIPKNNEQVKVSDGVISFNL